MVTALGAIQDMALLMMNAYTIVVVPVFTTRHGGQVELGVVVRTMITQKCIVVVNRLAIIEK